MCALRMLSSHRVACNGKLGFCAQYDRRSGYRVLLLYFEGTTDRQVGHLQGSNHCHYSRLDRRTDPQISEPRKNSITMRLGGDILKSCGHLLLVGSSIPTYGSVQLVDFCIALVIYGSFSETYPSLCYSYR